MQHMIERLTVTTKQMRSLKTGLNVNFDKNAMIVNTSMNLPVCALASSGVRTFVQMIKLLTQSMVAPASQIVT